MKDVVGETTLKLEDFVNTKSLDEVEVVKGVAKLKDNTPFTGAVEKVSKNGDKLSIEYVDGVIQKSTKVTNGTQVVKEYTNGVISKKNGEIVDIKKLQNEAKEQQAKLKHLLEDDKISAEEFKKQSDEIKYKSKKQELFNLRFQHSIGQL